MNQNNFIKLIENKLIESRTSNDYILRLINLYFWKLYRLDNSNSYNKNLFQSSVRKIFKEQMPNNIKTLFDKNIVTLLEWNIENLYDQIRTLNLNDSNIKLNEPNSEKELFLVNLLIYLDYEISNYLKNLVHLINQDYDISNIYNFWFRSFETSNINDLLKICNYYSYYFDIENKQLIKTEEKYQLDNIKIKTLSQLMYLYNSSKDMLSKECYFSYLAKKIFFIFDKNKIKYKDLIANFLKDAKINQLRQEINGYFRHNDQDPGQQKMPNSDYSFSQQWKQLSQEQKEQIMKETIPIYLFILSILRNNNLIDEFEQSFSLIPNETN